MSLSFVQIARLVVDGDLVYAMADGSRAPIAVRIDGRWILLGDERYDSLRAALHSGRSAGEVLAGWPEAPWPTERLSWRRCGQQAPTYEKRGSRLATGRDSWRWDWAGERVLFGVLVAGWQTTPAAQWDDDLRQALRPATGDPVPA